MTPTPQTTPTRDEAVPTGWKLVPVEPTEAMMAIGRTCGTNSANTYAAMLASAPAPASGGVDAVAGERAAKIAEAQVADAIGDDDAAKAYRMACHDCAEAIRSALSPAATPVSEAETVTMTRQQIDGLLRAAYPLATASERAGALEAALSQSTSAGRVGE